MNNYVKRTLNVTNIRNSQRHLKVGVTSLNTGIYRVFTEEEENLLDAVIGSAAIPGIFPPVKIGEEYFIDVRII